MDRDESGADDVVVELMSCSEGEAAGRSIQVTVRKDGPSVGVEDEVDEELTWLESMVCKVTGKVEGLKELIGELAEEGEEDVERKRKLLKGLKAIVRVVKKAEVAEKEWESEGEVLREAVEIAERRVRDAQAEARKLKS